MNREMIMRDLAKRVMTEEEWRCYLDPATRWDLYGPPIKSLWAIGVPEKQTDDESQ